MISRVNSCPACAKETSWALQQLDQSKFFTHYTLYNPRNNFLQCTTCIAVMNSVNPKNPCRFESASAQTFGNNKKINKYEFFQQPFHSHRKKKKKKVQPK